MIMINLLLLQLQIVGLSCCQVLRIGVRQLYVQRGPLAAASQVSLYNY